MDKLSVETYKNMTEENILHLHEVFNACWNKGVFPRVWKKAKVKVIRKAGDWDWSSPKSYRPISLLPTAGKILERYMFYKWPHRR